MIDHPQNCLPSPVLLLIFNRPSTTKQVFETVRQARPAQLFISGDGPRPWIPGEKESVEATRALVRNIDWPCETFWRLSDENQGCRLAISSAISWFFNNVSQGIILEDDCLPSTSFFTFCDTLLSIYQSDERVMKISGSGFARNLGDRKASYYFSRLNDIWGWATWKRAWDQFDLSMSDYPEFKRSGGIRRYYGDKAITAWMTRYMDAAFSGDDDIWSTQWSYAICRSNGLSINPVTNLVHNIGFTADATSGTSPAWRAYAKFEAEDLSELIHPKIVVPDVRAEKARFKIVRRTDPRAGYREFFPVRKARAALNKLRRSLVKFAEP